jgi:hypothetical protein
MFAWSHFTQRVGDQRLESIPKQSACSPNPFHADRTPLYHVCYSIVRLRLPVLCASSAPGPRPTVAPGLGALRAQRRCVRAARRTPLAQPRLPPSDRKSVRPHTSLAVWVKRFRWRMSRDE